MKQKKVELPLAHEVRIQYVRPVFTDMVSVSISEEAYDVILKYIGDLELDYKEYFWVLTLARSNRLLGISHISTGNVSSTVVSIPEIMQLALLSHASAVILIHNHPSGMLKFSLTDVSLTKQVQKALKLLEIQLLDHLVITSEGYISMADEGEIIS